MNCGGVFVKYVLFIGNVVLVILGLLLIYFGAIMISQFGHISSLEQAIHGNSIAIAVLVLGCVIFSICCLGCCGAIREKRFALMTYSGIVFIVFLCQLALIIFIWTNRALFLKQIDKAIDAIWKQRQTDQDVMNMLQLTFRCCGKDGYSDYMVDNQNITLPPSCCGHTESPCGIEEAKHRKGCSEAFSQFWNVNANLIRFGGIAASVVELGAVVFALLLGNQVQAVYGRPRYN